MLLQGTSDEAKVAEANWRVPSSVRPGSGKRNRAWPSKRTSPQKAAGQGNPTERDRCPSSEHLAQLAA